MEPITLFGALIVMFGLWVEFERELRAAARMICTSRFFIATDSGAIAQKTACVKRMPICLAKAYR
jgi:hypothetical protein